MQWHNEDKYDVFVKWSKYCKCFQYRVCISTLVHCLSYIICYTNSSFFFMCFHSLAVWGILLFGVIEVKNGLYIYWHKLGMYKVTLKMWWVWLTECSKEKKKTTKTSFQVFRQPSRTKYSSFFGETTVYKNWHLLIFLDPFSIRNVNSDFTFDSRSRQSQKWWVLG